MLGAPLPLAESLMVAWPQIVALASAVILLFVASYVAFQRQEVRLAPLQAYWNQTLTLLLPHFRALH